MRNGIISLSGIMALAAGIAVLDGSATTQAARADEIAGLRAAVIAMNIPGASAISQVGTFLNVQPPPTPPQCAHPIPSFFPSYIRRARYWTPSGSWSGAGRTSALRPPVSDATARSCQSTPAERQSCLFRRVSREAGDRHPRSADSFRCSAPTARTGSTASTTPALKPLRMLAQATPSAFPITTRSAASGRQTHRLGLPESVPPRFWTRQGVRSRSLPTRVIGAKAVAV